MSEPETDGDTVGARDSLPLSDGLSLISSDGDDVTLWLGVDVASSVPDAVPPVPVSDPVGDGLGDTLSDAVSVSTSEAVDVGFTVIDAVTLCENVRVSLSS